MTTPPPEYPAKLSIDYPDRPLNKLSSFFRIIVVIPILIVLGAISGGNWDSWGHRDKWQFEMGTAGVLFFATLLMILFRQKYPKWWFDWNVALMKFSYRVCAYVALLRDEYPSTDEEQAVHIEIAYPDVKKDLNRWLPLVKWLLAIPHFVILIVLAIVAFVLVVIAWFAILFTGSYPKDMFNLVVGVMRWGLRVEAYAVLLTTDRYPPFSLQP